MPHSFSGNESVQKRFSLAKKFEESPNYTHRLDRSIDTSQLGWMSEIETQNTTIIEKIMAQKPHGKVYAWVEAFKSYNGNVRLNRHMINMHRQYGYELVPATRHRPLFLMADNIYKSTDRTSISYTERYESNHDLYDDFYEHYIVEKNNILMERDEDVHLMYQEKICNVSKQIYDKFGPNGTANGDDEGMNNLRSFNMRSTKRMEEGDFVTHDYFMNRFNK